jgi:hypothetical protein
MMSLNNFYPFSFFPGNVNKNENYNLPESLKISADEIAGILEDKIKDPFFDERVRFSEEIRLHSLGETYLVERLLSKKYPGEPIEITNYKIKNWKKITKTFYQKILNTIAKFQKAEDFNIIHQNNILKDYTEYNLPRYGSVFNWFFTVGLNALLQEPNGVFLVAPDLNLTLEEIEEFGDDYRLQPQIHIFCARNVIFQRDNFILLQNSQKNDEYYYVDNKKIVKIEVDRNLEFSFRKKVKKINYTLLFEHNFNVIPCKVFGGIPTSLENDFLHESLISGVCPFWEEALLEFSELNAGIKQHVFPDKWRYVTGNCKNCNGTGKITLNSPSGKQTDKCSVCKGTGDPPTGMFSEILINQSSGLEEKPPIPPLGYVKKDFEPIEFLDKHYKSLLYEGLRAINLEFLTDSPLSQSGRAKEMDRQESNAFLGQVARHSIENVLVPIYNFVALWLFPETTLKEVSKNIAPTITIPVQFDYLLSEADNNIKNAKDSGIRGYLFAELEKRYINNKFENFEFEKTYLLLINQLDPLRGFSVDEKIELYNNGCISQLDLVASANISKIVYTAIEKTYGYSFAKKSYEAQMEFVYNESKKILKIIDSDILRQKQSYELQQNNPLLQTSEQGNGDFLPDERESPTNL